MTPLSRHNIYNAWEMEKMIKPYREPQDYTADQDLERRVHQFLLQRQVPGLRRVSVSARRGNVELRGELKSFYEKQLCLSCSQRVAGVIRLVDRLAVSDPVRATG